MLLGKLYAIMFYGEERAKGRTIPLWLTWSIDIVIVVWGFFSYAAWGLARNIGDYLLAILITASVPVLFYLVRRGIRNSFRKEKDAVDQKYRELKEGFVSKMSFSDAPQGADPAETGSGDPEIDDGFQELIKGAKEMAYVPGDVRNACNDLIAKAKELDQQICRKEMPEEELLKIRERIYGIVREGAVNLKDRGKYYYSDAEYVIYTIKLYYLGVPSISRQAAEDEDALVRLANIVRDHLK